MGLRGRAKSRGGWSRAQRSDVGGGRGDVDMGGRERPRGRRCSDRLEAGHSVVEVGVQRLVEYQLRDELGLGRIEDGGLVEGDQSGSKTTY